MPCSFPFIFHSPILSAQAIEDSGLFMGAAILCADRPGTAFGIPCFHAKFPVVRGAVSSREHSLPGNPWNPRGECSTARGQNVLIMQKNVNEQGTFPSIAPQSAGIPSQFYFGLGMAHLRCIAKTTRNIFTLYRRWRMFQNNWTARNITQRLIFNDTMSRAVMTGMVLSMKLYKKTNE